MPMTLLGPENLASDHLGPLLAELYAGETAALAIAQVPYSLHMDSGGKASLGLPWIDDLGLFTPDRDTELGGTAFLPDMPPHIDPHPKDSLKVVITTEGKALGKFVLNVPTDVLDATNELPGSDYALLRERGITPEEVVLSAATAVCFLGSVTMHHMVSFGDQRKSYINSYRPLKLQAV